MSRESGGQVKVPLEIFEKLKQKNLTKSQSESRRRSQNEDQPHIGKYRLLKTIGKGNFAKGTRFFKFLAKTTGPNHTTSHFL